MTLKALYNDAASHYATADWFGSITLSHDCALSQIKKACLGMRSHYKVLDLGVGDGAFLKRLHTEMPLAEFTGLDVSEEMLKQAVSNVTLTPIEATVNQVSQFLPPHSQDLVLAHFINAYVPIHTLLNEVRLISRATGHFSYMTSTYESFPVAQKQLAEFIANDSILSRVVGHYYKAILKNTMVASGEAELLRVFKEHQLHIVDHQRIHVPIKLNNFDELAAFGLEGTWFLNTLSIRMLPRNFLIKRLRRLFVKFFTFPYEDTHVIDVILARK